MANWVVGIMCEGQTFFCFQIVPVPKTTPSTKKEKNTEKKTTLC